MPDTSVDPLSKLTKQQQEDQIQKSEIDISDEEFYALIQAIPTPLQSSSLMQAMNILKFLKRNFNLYLKLMKMLKLYLLKAK